MLGLLLHTFNQYAWAQGHPGQRPPQKEITLYSDFAHKANRRPKPTDNMNAAQIKAYIAGKL